MLSRRALNRTLLRRQVLAERTALSAAEVVERLVIVQAQEPNWPYVGLWTRIEGFRHEHLTALIEGGQVVRGASLRGTQHLSTADDFPWLRPLAQPLLDRGPRAGFGAELVGLDLAEVAEAGRELLAGRTLKRAELARLLAERFPGYAPGPLGWTSSFLVPQVHPAPSSTWGAWGNRVAHCVLAEEALGRSLEPAPSPEVLVRRYLAAFGPATVRDAQAWSGVTRLRAVVDGMRSELRTYRDEDGRELVDLPDAPLADPDAPAPVRFLPGFDNAILGHADRSRVIGDDDRRRVVTGSLVRPTFLVDGFVAGTWSLRGSTVTVVPFRPLAPADEAALHDEAASLLPFLTGAPGTCEVAPVPDT